MFVTNFVYLSADMFDFVSDNFYVISTNNKKR